MFLAYELGRPLQEIGEMDPDVFALWVAWFEHYSPSLKEDMRAGIIAATIANSAFGSKGGWKPSDFMPSLANANDDETEEEMERRMIAWCANVGGTVKTERRPDP